MTFEMENDCEEVGRGVPSTATTPSSRVVIPGVPTATATSVIATPVTEGVFRPVIVAARGLTAENECSTRKHSSCPQDALKLAEIR